MVDNKDKEPISKWSGRKFQLLLLIIQFVKVIESRSIGSNQFINQ